MKKYIKEFKDFIATGDLVTIAVGLVIALKVKDVIDQFMAGVVNPLIAGIFGKANFDDVGSFRIGSATNTIPDPKFPKDPTKTITQHGALVQPGVVITALINLIIVGLVLFLIIKAYNKMKKKSEAIAGPSELDVLTEIRDELRRRQS